MDFKDFIFATGGSYGLNGHTTDIIDVSNGTNRKGGKMNHARYGHGMGVVKWNGVSRLLAIRGFMKEAKVNTNEVWNKSTEKWEILEDLIEVADL